ncbi:class I SAM-dependent methyltransferase [Streptomyces sp. NPDC049906]|uniref:class I SAM-dependent methyltransferase n=1 Tax=Streptomyces sp. NPDC049906 TaxID=3155656 RepID=UPI0034490FB1
MRNPLPDALQALDRFHSARPWDHNAHYHRWLLRQLPARFDTALDVGSGSGDLARRLARRARSVRGIDADASLVEQAQRRTAPGAPITFTCGDALVEPACGPFDVITCVAVAHHLPHVEALARFRRLLAPGGTLVIVGVARPASPVDRVLGAVAVPLNVLMAVWKNRGRRVPRPVAMTAPVRPAVMTFAEVVRDARRELPGARLRRRVFWRYTLVWRKEPG